MKKVTTKNNGPIVQLAALRAAVDDVLTVAMTIKVKPAALAEKIDALRVVRDRGRGKPADTERLTKIQAMHAAGKTLTEIMTETDASESTVRRAIKTAGKGAE